MGVLTSSPTFHRPQVLVHSKATPNFVCIPPALKAFVHMHSFTPQSAMMPEVRALPTPWRASTTCCHSNKTRSQMQPLHLTPFSPPLYYLYWFLLVYLPFFCLIMTKKRKRTQVVLKHSYSCFHLGISQYVAKYQQPLQLLTYGQICMPLI